ncbi:MAG: flavin reductase [Gloeomargaritaceae cyanobacterium C42_A2020_066]|nr:flavin reductase [Gloeomargaritaceae cyanobacterium C42_A2020_066]
MGLLSPGSIVDHSNRELYLVTAAAAGRRSGCIATWVMPYSLVPQPRRILISLSRLNFTQELVAARGQLALHLLDQAQLPWVARFGLSSGRDQDKFADLAVTESPTGLPLLGDTCGWLICQVLQTVDTGDRVLYLTEAVAEHFNPAGRPLREADLGRLPPDIQAALGEKYQRDVAQSALYVRRDRV